MNYAPLVCIKVNGCDTAFSATGGHCSKQYSKANLNLKNFLHSVVVPKFYDEQKYKKFLSQVNN